MWIHYPKTVDKLSKIMKEYQGSYLCVGVVVQYMLCISVVLLSLRRLQSHMEYGTVFYHCL